jgi:hypothetical protein
MTATTKISSITSMDEGRRGLCSSVRLQGSSQTEAAPRFNNDTAATPGPGSRRVWDDIYKAFTLAAK